MDNFVTWLVAASALVITTIFWLSMQSDDSIFKGAAERAGLTNVSVGDTAIFSCGRDDSLARQITATNSRGQRVQAVVCCGMVLKACTVRY